MTKYVNKLGDQLSEIHSGVIGGGSAVIVPFAIVVRVEIEGAKTIVPLSRERRWVLDRERDNPTELERIEPRM